MGLFLIIEINFDEFLPRGAGQRGHFRDRVNFLNAEIVFVSNTDMEFWEINGIICIEVYRTKNVFMYQIWPEVTEMVVYGK